MIHRIGHLQGNSPLSLDRPPSRNFHWFNYPAFHILSHGRFLIFVLFLKLHYIGKLSKSLVIGNLLNPHPFPLLGESASQFSNTALVFPGTRPCPEATYGLAATSQLISILKALSL